MKKLSIFVPILFVIASIIIKITKKMAKVSFKAELDNGQGSKLVAGLQLFTFKEDDMYIVYCPALDLSAYDTTEKKALNSFQQVFKMHIEYCLQKKTLVKDLQKYGWKIKSLKQKKIKAPDMEELLEKNDVLKDIIYHKDYKKESHNLEFPELV